MNAIRTITATPEFGDTESILSLYRNFMNDITLTGHDLFAFLTTPTPEREEFFAVHCTCTYSSTDNIVTPTFTAL